MHELVKLKIKATHKPELLGWAEYLNNNLDEVIKSLKQENVFIESWYYEESGEYINLYCFWHLNNKEQAKKGVESSNLGVDVIHKEFKKKCWIRESKTTLTPLLFAQNDSFYENK